MCGSSVPLWKQKSGCGDQPVIWDYHVILLQASLESDTQVYDLDSELSFPCSLELYASQALRSDHSLRPMYHRKFRVIPAEIFLMNFASDRSHMRNPDGTWKMPPPPYPPIRTAESQMNLETFINMNPPSFPVGTTAPPVMCRYAQEAEVYRFDGSVLLS
uniref:Protein N-terminal glutamine amidohydrolase n=1 Tax=Takifugu rubripes TaxID=31033 RepID=A0A674MMK2_TAKRU